MSLLLFAYLVVGVGIVTYTYMNSGSYAALCWAAPFALISYIVSERVKKIK